MSHPDKDFVNFILAGIKNGFYIGFDGPSASYTAPNMNSARENPIILDEYITEELKQKRI